MTAQQEPASGEPPLASVERLFYHLFIGAASLIAFDHGGAAKEQHMTVLPSDVGPFDALTDRWLIEALSQMSSNPRVRCAAAAWLDARRTALELGLAEEDAQARADATLQREVGTDSPRFGHERHEPVRNPDGLEDTTNG